MKYTVNTITGKVEKEIPTASTGVKHIAHKEDKCPFYQGVCGVDESYICYCSLAYKECDIYKSHIEKEKGFRR